MALPSGEAHPATSGREAQLERLAASVRRLVLLTVTNRAPAEDTAAFAEQLDSVADRLQAHVPDPPPPTYFPVDGPSQTNEGIETKMPFDVVIGPYSPLALPVELSFDPPKAVGRARFTEPYEGPPGCIHGAVIAATFDIVLTAANLLAGAAGPTSQLSIRYRRPTLLHEEAAFEAWVTRREGRRTFSEGRILQNGAVTAEARGEFVVLARSETRAMGGRGDDPGSAD